MVKRMIAWLVCLVLIVAAFPTAVTAVTTEEEEQEEQRICDRISAFYWRILRHSGQSTLEGWCGYMAGWELYLMGVTGQPYTFNGNDQFDFYENLEKTDVGYKVEAYPVEEYTAQEAMNTITRSGTINVYNLMAGFQKTRTVAGQKYGHVTAIHAILDGNVYYTEGFDTPYGLLPQEAHICTIEEWADFYETWSTFEGLVYFGTKSYIDFCTYYPADLFVVSDQPQTLVSQPGGEAMTDLRATVSGERLHAIGIYQDAEGTLYYQIDDGERICYVAAEGLTPWYMNYTDVRIQGAALPETVETGADFQVAGDIYSVNNRLSQITVEVTDSRGTPVQTVIWTKDSCFFDLSRASVNDLLDFSQLPGGSYTYTVTVDVANHYVKDGAVEEEVRQIPLAGQAFTVGNEATQGSSRSITANAQALNGWQCLQGKWYYFNWGTPRTGWYCENGLDYYLLEDGSVATGWQNINGYDRYFSATGVMRTGWLDTEDGRMYMLCNGVAAVGWRTIHGSRYFFDENGILQPDITDPQI